MQDLFLVSLCSIHSNRYFINLSVLHIYFFPFCFLVVLCVCVCDLFTLNLLSTDPPQRSVPFSFSENMFPEDQIMQLQTRTSFACLLACWSLQALLNFTEVKQIATTVDMFKHCHFPLLPPSVMGAVEYTWVSDALQLGTLGFGN